jgi:FKBP-type peptidyl-prolyl cis-trans isomerase (trigger factor)
MIRNYAENLAKPTAEQYKMDIQQIVPMYMQMAEYSIKSHFILEQIKKLEKVEISDELREETIKEAAENMKMEVAQYKKLYKKQIESEDFTLAVEERVLMDNLEKYSKIVPYPKAEEKKEK